VYYTNNTQSRLELKIGETGAFQKCKDRVIAPRGPHKAKYVAFLVAMCFEYSQL